MNLTDSARLGQFVVGQSLLHRLDPRTKLAISFVFTATLFLVNSFSALLALAAIGGLLCALSRLPAGRIARSLQPILMTLVAISLLHLFASPGPYLLEAGPIKLSQPGIIEAGLVDLRLGTLLVVAALIAWTTPPGALAQAFELILRPLARFGFPVLEFATAIGIALRFVPTLITQLQRLVKAQEARGVDFSNGNILQRARALMSLGIPLLVATMERSDELAQAMESRCYPGRQRTSFRRLKMESVDAYVLFGCLAWTSVILALLR